MESLESTTLGDKMISTAKDFADLLKSANKKIRCTEQHLENCNREINLEITDDIFLQWCPEKKKILYIDNYTCENLLDSKISKRLQYSGYLKHF